VEKFTLETDGGYSELTAVRRHFEMDFVGKLLLIMAIFPPTENTKMPKYLDIGFTRCADEMFGILECYPA
jgi:hypothetical protein